MADQPAVTRGSTQAPTGRRKLIDSLSRRFRASRDGPLRAMIAAERAKVSGRFTILDLGGRGDYWLRVGLDFLDRHDVHVVCLNRTEDEIRRVDGETGRIAHLIGDACDFSGAVDQSYSMVHSNSVIEHVGTFAMKRAFASEVHRLAPVHYIQTPYFWSPIDPHWPLFPFFHWLPMSWRYRLLLRFALGWGGKYRDVAHAMGDLEGTTLIDGRQARTLFPASRIRLERVAGIPKSLIIEKRSQP